MRHARRTFVLLALLAVTILLVTAAPALAGQASTGELLFYPCTTCHPITDAQLAAGRTFPNGFKGHEIVLEGHDVLGKGQAACLACHDDPSRNPGMLKSVDGTLVSVDGDVSLVCFRCHSGKYAEWKAGTHGKGLPKCTSAGCHDPHTPGYIYARPLLPFVGTGFQFRVLPVRGAFMPLMEPAPRGIPPVDTPVWFVIVVVVGMLVALGLVATLVLVGRSKR
jgi:hypothetical protein